MTVTGIVREAGLITLGDGSEIKGIVIEYPDGPPELPVSAIWDRTPVVVILASEHRPATPGGTP